MDDNATKELISLLPDMSLAFVFAVLFLREQKQHHKLMEHCMDEMRKVMMRQIKVTSGSEQKSE